MPDMEQGGNPDAAQDTDLIQSVMQEMLGPIFEVIASRLKDLEEDLGETKDLLMKMTEGIIGAADGHRRSVLSEQLSSKYGKDMEPFDGFYKDVHGKGFSDSVLEELMGGGDMDEAGIDEFMKKKLDEAKGKYGKYVGIKAEVEPPAEAAQEAAAPEMEAAEPEEKQEAESAEPAAMGSIDQIFNEVKSLGGKKRKLSEPIGK